MTWIVLATLLVCCGEDPPAPFAEPVTSEHCGMACIYSMLKLHGRPRSLEQITARVYDLFPHARISELSLLELRRTIESYGLHAASVRVSGRTAARIPAPSILYLRPESVGNARVGHVVILLSINDHRAVISDFTAGIGRREVTLDELKTFWGGEMIVVSKTPIQPVQRCPSRWIPALGVMISGIFLAWRVFAVRAKRSRKRDLLHTAGGQ